MTGPERRAAIAAGEYLRRPLRLPKPAEAGRALDTRLLATAGVERDLALDEADAYVDVILDELERVQRAGGRGSVAAAAAISGIDRTTIIRHRNRRLGRQ